MATRAEASIASFMKAVQRYECLYNKFSEDYKNRKIRKNCRNKLGDKFRVTAKQADNATKVTGAVDHQ